MGKIPVYPEDLLPWDDPFSKIRRQFFYALKKKKESRGSVFEKRDHELAKHWQTEMMKYIYE